jgi:hypothetical protein
VSITRIQASVGPEAAAKLSRDCGGAGVYVRSATPKYTEITREETEAAQALYLRGYCNNEIAPLVGRSTQSVVGMIRRGIDEGKLPRLPAPQSVDGKAIRQVLRMRADTPELPLPRALISRRQIAGWLRECALFCEAEGLRREASIYRSGLAQIEAAQAAIEKWIARYSPRAREAA